MDSIEVILSFFDDSLYHEDESVCSALNGITNQESEWQHSAYSDEQHWPGHQPTIPDSCRGSMHKHRPDLLPDASGSSVCVQGNTSI